MKIAILNDTHCGIRNSSDIFLKNAEDFFGNVFFPYCEEHGIKQIVHLGDYYDHRKFVNFKALNHNRKHFLDRMREMGMHMDIIPGNHDTFYKNTNDLNSLKECLGHYMNEIHIIMEPTVMDYDGFKLAMLPWITSENYNESINFIQNCKADWLGGHLELNGFEMMRGVRNTHGMDHKLFNRFEKVLTGHYHVGSMQDNVHYLGSQMEFFGVMQMIQSIFTFLTRTLGNSKEFAILILFFIGFIMTMSGMITLITMSLRLMGSS